MRAGPPGMIRQALQRDLFALHASHTQAPAHPWMHMLARDLTELCACKGPDSRPPVDRCPHTRPDSHAAPMSPVDGSPTMPLLLPPQHPRSRLKTGTPPTCHTSMPPHNIHKRAPLGVPTDSSPRTHATAECARQLSTPLLIPSTADHAHPGQGTSLLQSPATSRKHPPHPGRHPSAVPCHTQRSSHVAQPPCACRPFHC